MLRYCILGLTVALSTTGDLGAELRHQYTFNDGTADDSIGGMHGTIVNPLGVPTRFGGQLDMRSNNGFGSNQEGGTGDFTRFVDGVYVDLPNFMFSDIARENFGILSFEAWVTVETDRTWQRILDFGTSNLGEDTASNGDSSDYIFLTPNSGGNTVQFTIRNGLSQADGNAFGGTERSTGVPHHYVTVIDQTDTSVGANGSTFLYVDGEPAGMGTLPDGFFLEFIIDENNWLGRSQWNDPLLDATFDEFRVYDHALSAEEVARSFEAGPEPFTAFNPQFVINREDQTITLTNPGSEGNLAGYSLSSGAGALNSTAWTPISGRLDSAGDGSFDPDSAWNIDTMTNEELAESAATGDGGRIATEGTISLGTTWFASPVEDVIAQVQLGDGSIVGAEVIYTGNGDAPFVRSDLNFDGTLDANDWPIFIANLFTDFSGMTSAQSYGLGDLNGDLVSDVNDYRIFRTDFEAANGAAAFAALASGIPEPSTIVLVAIIAAALAGGVYRRSTLPRLLASVKRALPLCAVLLGMTAIASLARAEIVNRWSFFEQGGTVVTDIVGGADGRVLGAGRIRDGRVTLPGGPSATAAYVDLPNGIISRLTDATIEGWAIVDGAQAWARLFDFGSTAGGEVFAPGGGGEGQDYFMLSVSRGTDNNVQRLELRNLDPLFGGSDAGNVVGTTQLLDTSIPTTLGEEFHFAVVYDSNLGEMREYRNGELIDVANVSIALGNLNDVNNWLGRSNWTNDANFQGSFNEFRIYDDALDDAAIAASFAAGPDAGLADLPVLELEVNTVSGNVLLHNRQANPIGFDFYQISSTAGALDVTGWNSLDEQDLDAIGTGFGESWDQAGAANEFTLGEAFLQGMTVLEANSSINLGRAYNPAVLGAGVDGDLQFLYSQPNGAAFGGLVTYNDEPPIGGIPGDYNNSGQTEQGDLDLVLLNWGGDFSTLPAGWIIERPTEGIVDQAELDRVLLNWGALAALGGSAGVPEPSTTAVAIILLLMLTAAGIKRRCKWSS